MKLLLRLAPDLTIKSDRIRAKFLNRLVHNIRTALEGAGIEYKLTRQWSRMFVETGDLRAKELLSRVFGLSSLSVIEHECEANVDQIVELGTEAYRELVKGKTFAIRARRVGNHPYTSMDVAKALGAALRPFATKVDLKSPEVEITVEIRDHDAYLYSGGIRAPGGLPLGVSGKVLCLFSGGFDSAVAAWMMMKRGVDVEFALCNLAGQSYERQVLGLAKFLSAEWGFGSRPKFHVLDFTKVADGIRQRVKPSHAQIILKRCFYRVADRLAQEAHCDAILTGECVGQVSSQTLKNLRTIEDVAERPIIRPVVAMDKLEICDLAKRIGTFDLSAAIQEYCQLVPDKPVTACKPESARREEQDFDFTTLDVALAEKRTLMLKDLTPADLVMPYLYVSELPAGAAVIDCRPEAAYEGWHYPEALQYELHDLLTDFKRLDKKRPYVLYCPYGLQSSVAAEKMQKAGFQAYSFKGGVSALRDYSESQLR